MIFFITMTLGKRTVLLNKRKILSSPNKPSLESSSRLQSNYSHWHHGIIFRYTHNTPPHNCCHYVETFLKDENVSREPRLHGACAREACPGPLSACGQYFEALFGLLVKWHCQNPWIVSHSLYVWKADECFGRENYWSIAEERGFLGKEKAWRSDRESDLSLHFGSLLQSFGTICTHLVGVVCVE